MEDHSKTVTELYPATGRSLQLEGLYLNRDLSSEKSDHQPFIYANFLSSLDGRIALREPGEPHHDLPEELKTSNDFRLFLELHAHSDCIITHSGYMRALHDQRLGNVLHLPKNSGTQYLHDWRTQHGLKAAPDVIVLSSTLDFPLDEAWLLPGQSVYLLTGQAHDRNFRSRWLERGYPVTVLSSTRTIDAPQVNKFLIDHGYRSVYLVAGPQLLQSMVQHSLISRFFLTLRHQLIGGGDFHTLIPETMMGDRGSMSLRSLYLDQSDGPHRAQWFSEFGLL